MRHVLLLATALACSACSASNSPQLTCDVQQTANTVGADDRHLTIVAAASAPDQKAGATCYDVRGTIENQTETKPGKAAVHGTYCKLASGEIELYAMSERPGDLGKLNITALPDHPVLKQRGTKAVIMTDDQTVATGAPAQVNCRLSGL